MHTLLPTVKLCMACPVFYPTFAGGSLRYLRYQPGLRQRQVQTWVLAGTARAKERSLAEMHLGWHQQPVGKRLPDENVEDVPVRRIRLPDKSGWRRTSVYFRALLSLCQEDAYRPDVIQLHSFERPETIYWLDRLKTFKIPLIYAVMLAPTLSRGNFLKRALGLRGKRMLKAFYKRMDMIVANSEQVSDFLDSIGVSTPIEIIPNGVDLQRFRPAHGKQERQLARNLLGISGNGPLILTVGAVSPRKGSDLLLGAWIRLAKQFPTAQLIFVGPRHDQNNPKLKHFEDGLRNLIEASGAPDRVHFVGFSDQVQVFYRAADIFVLPTKHEGSPNVVLEAMASSVPVVLTAFHGQSTAIGKAGTEFEQTERNPEAITQILTQLLRDSRRRRELAYQGRIWVQKHLDVENSLDRYADIYRRLASKSQKTVTALPHR